MGDFGGDFGVLTYLYSCSQYCRAESFQLNLRAAAARRISAQHRGERRLSDSACLNLLTKASA